LKNNILYIILLAGLWACTKESEVKLELSGQILSFKPDYSRARTFSSEGDTLKLELLSNSSSFSENGALNGNYGAFNGVDRLLLEQEDYRIGSDSLGLSFNYQFRCAYAETAPSLRNDFLYLNFSDSLQEMNPDLSLRFDGDTNIFLLNRTFYSDSIFIADKYFYEVVASQADNGMAVYLNSLGLIGFTTSANRTFQIVN
tara:strand:- start:87 stop:686 length:600 start_codon:yes stop_codon:yes gene_type:complete